MSQIIPNSHLESNGQTDRVRFHSSLADLLKPVASPIGAVNELLEFEVGGGNEILAERLASSGISHGKRMRPALLLLAGGCFGDIKKTHIAAAAAVEMFHVATLVHDDVLDGAVERRHEQSMNQKWDNTTTILAGDFLFTKAMEIGCKTGSVEAVRRMANACCGVCNGEISQNAYSGNFEISEEQYIDVIALKTAELCKCACGLGALLSECDTETVAGFEQFGEDIGVAFQIIDDILDIVGDEKVVGKTLGTDLKNQKATLPLIHCLRTVSAPRRNHWIQRLKRNDWTIQEAQQLLVETNSIEYARQTARTRANRALNFSRGLGDSDYAASLAGLAHFVIERTY